MPDFQEMWEDQNYHFSTDHFWCTECGPICGCRSDVHHTRAYYTEWENQILTFTEHGYVYNENNEIIGHFNP